MSRCSARRCCCWWPTSPARSRTRPRFHKRTAGAETNVAIGLSRLGLKVGWASRLGTDSMGRALLATMQGEGIDCSHVICDATQRTGFQFKGRVTDGSDPPVEYHRKGSAASHMGPADVDEAWLRSARHLHATGVFAAISDTSLQAAIKSHGRDARRRPHDLLRPQPAAHAVGLDRSGCGTGSTSWRRAPTGCCPAWRRA